MKNIFILLLGCLLFTTSCKSKQGIPQGDDDQTCETTVLTKGELMDLLYSKKMPNVQFIDIRTPHDYAMGHLPNAINMPMNNFLNKREFAKLNKDAVLILYGEDASSPQMVALMAEHFTNGQFYTVAGGYEFIKTKILDGFGIHSGLYDDEVPLVNFKEASEEIRSRASSAPKKAKRSTTAKKKPLVKRKKKSVSGGCG